MTDKLRCLVMPIYGYMEKVEMRLSTKEVDAIKPHFRVEVVSEDYEAPHKAKPTALSLMAEANLRARVGAIIMISSINEFNREEVFKAFVDRNKKET